MSHQVTTGVPTIDRALEGGLPAGRIATLLAEPASQAELLLSGFVSQQETVYLSAERTPLRVTGALEGPRSSYDELTVSKLDTEAPVTDAIASLGRIPDESLVVIDSFEPLERADPGRFRAFLEKLCSVLAQTDSVALLHALKHDQTPPQRHRTKYRSDIVLDLVTETTDDGIQSKLFIPKFRGGCALTDPLSLELTDSIYVDTSRNIA